jgi:hypothetical protein
MNHTTEQVKIKCLAIMAVIRRLKQAKEEGEAYETLGHLIDSADQLCGEVEKEDLFERITAAREVC